jgi:hypothetical protein
MHVHDYQHTGEYHVEETHSARGESLEEESQKRDELRQETADEDSGHNEGGGCQQGSAGATGRFQGGDATGADDAEMLERVDENVVDAA